MLAAFVRITAPNAGLVHARRMGHIEILFKGDSSHTVQVVGGCRAAPPTRDSP